MMELKRELLVPSTKVRRCDAHGLDMALSDCQPIAGKPLVTPSSRGEDAHWLTLRASVVHCFCCARLQSGDARVGMIGFPSVGKSTLLTKLTGTHSEAAESVATAGEADGAGWLDWAAEACWCASEPPR